MLAISAFIEVYTSQKSWNWDNKRLEKLLVQMKNMEEQQVIRVFGNRSEASQEIKGIFQSEPFGCKDGQRFTNL